MITFKIVQCHPGVAYIFNFWHSGTLALRDERQSARMSEIKNVGYTWMANCDQLTHLAFRGLSGGKFAVVRGAKSIGRAVVA